VALFFWQMDTYLHLENGEKIKGLSFGSSGESSGEVVFSTGMTGYIQSLTDPSFAGQILTFSYPLVGNYGVPEFHELAPHLMENAESESIWVKGIVVGQYVETPSHYQSVRTLSNWMNAEKVPGISLVDTRRLTQMIRDEGCMRGIISTSKSVKFTSLIESVVPQTTCKEIIIYKSKLKNAKKIILIDCGVKHGIIRALLRRGYEVTRIPYNANPLDFPGFDGVVCSNGPGDPKMVPETIANIKKVLNAGYPYLGICLGHQLLALAVGADTYKLKYGHRGLNQPCQDIITKKAYVTSQNHGYAVDRKTIPKDYQEWFINLNDKTNEGIKHKTRNIQSVQFHPEGDPGPFDTKWIFGVLNK
jgi:carbamoyl-phosphate synthase small subunit